MTLLSDEEADEIRRDVEAGIHGPILRKWIRQLLEDRAERIAAAAAVSAGSTSRTTSRCGP